MLNEFGRFGIISCIAVALGACSVIPASAPRTLGVTGGATGMSAPSTTGSREVETIGGIGAAPSIVAGYRLLHSFVGYTGGYKGACAPMAGLVAVSGILYGMTPNCGAHNLGTVFSVSTTGAEHTVYNFVGGHDGQAPQGGLIDFHGTLYGTTVAGGNHLNGTVFAVSTTGAEGILHKFTGPQQGPGASGPMGDLLAVDGKLYGTTRFGGKGYGTVFSLTLSGSQQELYKFAGPDGAKPEGTLINVDGTLYGTTSEGGTYGGGTIFSLTQSGEEHVLHSFESPFDGGPPMGALVALGGVLYGTTSGGGVHGEGSVFSIDTAGTAYKQLYSFGAAGDGVQPASGLVAAGGFVRNDGLGRCILLRRHRFPHQSCRCGAGNVQL